jgi:hypothetical protein
LTELLERIDLVASMAKGTLEREGTDAEREQWFANDIRALLRRNMPEADAQAYETAGRFDLNWRGLARYWRKRS